MALRPDFSLTGRRALITGGSRGIGRAIAEAFADSGGQVTICARSSDEINQTVGELTAKGYCAESFAADVTDIDAMASVIRTRPAFDILVNNAGTNRPKPLSEATADDYDQVMGLTSAPSSFFRKLWRNGWLPRAAGARSSTCLSFDPRPREGATPFQ